MTTQLIRYEAARHALAECKALDEVKEWADRAAAMQAYGRMANDKGLEVDAAEIRIRAERRLGEMIALQKADQGLNKGTQGQLAGKSADGSLALVSDEGQKATPKLADVGISYDLSSRAQKLAAVPEAEFEREVVDWRERVSEEGKRVTARLEQAGAKAMDSARPAPQPEPEPEPEGPSLAELVDELQRENETLTAQLKATEADDLKAEALKWRRAYDHACRQQSEAMERATESVRREAKTMKLLRRCGKAVGEEDPDKIPPTVEAMARASKNAAA